MNRCDFLVIGGGIVGINVALELKRAFRDSEVVLIEKEDECARHASGRNSGVLHAGFYYTADSLKARFARTGNRLLTEYCLARKLAINRCGKLVVARTPEDLPQLDELIRRGTANGVPLEALSEKDAKKIEPRAKTFERALFSPTTSSIDPVEIVLSMRRDAEREGVQIRTGVRYVKKASDGVLTSAGTFDAGYVVNSAGLYADKIARDFGFSADYRILPFKGLYLWSDEPAGSLRTSVYPVPDLRNPFLGVHFTVTADGRATLGPTAIPAFWREQYEGFRGFRPGECAEILAREAGLFLFSGFDFRRLAFQEIQKYSRAKMVQLASALVDRVNPGDYTRWGRAGIRAQLVHVKKRKLEMDFVLEGDRRSFHVLNTVSPGFTCAIPFSRYICDEIKKKISPCT